MGHKDVGVVSFTGSTDVGRRVSEACAPAFKHCHLEMGGKNVIMVMDDARLDLAVEGALWGGFGTTGQRCTAASRVVVHEKVYKEFVERFAAGAKALKVGNGLEPEDAGGALRQRRAARDRRELREDRQGRGGTLLAGGSRPRHGRPRPRLLPRAHDLRRLLAEDASRPRGDLRAGGLGDPGALARGSDRGRQLRRVRPVRLDLHPGRQQGLHGHARDVHRASSTSTRPRSAPRPTCPSAGPRTPATATARPASRRSTCSPSGRASTSTSAASCKGPRSTEHPFPCIISVAKHARDGLGRPQA